MTNVGIESRRVRVVVSTQAATDEGLKNWPDETIFEGSRGELAQSRVVPHEKLDRGWITVYENSACDVQQNVRTVPVLDE